MSIVQQIGKKSVIYRREKRSTSQRLSILDELRGVAIILMVIYHTVYQGVLWGVLPTVWLDHPIVELSGMGARLLFITLAGICASFSRHNIRRGLEVLLCGFVITGVTLLITPEEAVYFGILHFLGVSMILYGLSKGLWKKISPIIGAIICSVIYNMGYEILYEEMWLANIKSIEVIANLSNEGYLNVVGLPENSFYSSDYFPLIPWGFLFLSGTFLGQVVMKYKEKMSTVGGYLGGLAFLGRHSLLIYMIHIPVIVGGLMLGQMVIR